MAMHARLIAARATRRKPAGLTVIARCFLLWRLPGTPRKVRDVDAAALADDAAAAEGAAATRLEAAVVEVC